MADVTQDIIVDEPNEGEEEAVNQNAALPSRVIHEVIRRYGEEELCRPASSLFWSGIAAGILISFSILGEAVFRTHLPDTDSRFLIENIGYTFGFLLVILGRMQLFTENTITTVLPFVNRPGLRMLRRVSRLWSIVLLANVIGAFAAAAVMAFTGALPEVLIPAVQSLSQHAVGMGAMESFMRGIPAGILIAAIVWMMPQAESAGFFVIFLFTWLIAAGDFTHVVAGSVEMAFLILTGDLGVLTGFLEFFVPTLFGNIVGGTVIFALLAWSQVKEELDPPDM